MPQLTLLMSQINSELTEIHSQNIGDRPHALGVAIMKCKPLPVDWNSGMAEAVDLLIKHRMQLVRVKHQGCLKASSGMHDGGITSYNKANNP